MTLIDREGSLAALSDVLTAAGGTGGRLVLVSGEAGAGKTSVVRAFLAQLSPRVTKLWGACDSLSTARPFGPLLDWAAQADRPLAAAIADGAAREIVFERTLALLGRGVTFAVLEDLHWADEATLDLFGFLARRLERSSTTLVATFRADEVNRHHPLATVLGELATLRPVRVPIAPLSVEGVARLARGRGVDPVDLHRRTGGNAFFVTECLSSVAVGGAAAGVHASPDQVGGDGDVPVPATVRDAVLARADRLSPAARAALDAVATVPGRAELWLAKAAGAFGPAIDECVARGVLVAEGSVVRFRHELAREAVHEALLPDQRQRIHRRALAALESPPSGRVDHARATHHAVESGDVDAVLRHAPAAARAAELAEARREAVAHLELAVRHADRLDAARRIELWSRLADQCSALGRHDRAVEAYEHAIALAVSRGDEERRGELLARLWAPLSMSGDVDRAGRVAEQARLVLEGRTEGPALALAYAQQCSQHMLARELTEAEPWGRAALELAARHRDDEVLSYALIQSGVALWMAGDEAGLDRLRDGVRIARSVGLTRLVVHGLSQIGAGGGEVRCYGEAVPALEECVAFAERHELGSRGLYAAAWLARCQVALGRWAEAGATLAALAASPRCEGITRMTVLTEIGRLRARRGDPDIWAPLDDALAHARRTGHIQRLWPVAVARAEAAWLEDRLDSEVSNLRHVHAVAARLAYPWAVGETGLWLWRAGVVGEVPGAAEPYALHIGGRPAEAARIWAKLGCVYDQAVALADSPAGADQLAALALFERLDAKPVARRLVERRRSAGLPVLRGINAATRNNPGRLTDRETEVLRLVAAGCTNPEIGTQLRISAKTVGHHVSHVLTKLGARSRAEAVAAAVESGLRFAR